MSNKQRELRQGFEKRKTGEADAYFYVSDAMIASQAPMIIQATLAKKPPSLYNGDKNSPAGNEWLHPTDCQLFSAEKSMSY